MKAKQVGITLLTIISTTALFNITAYADNQSGDCDISSTHSQEDLAKEISDSYNNPQLSKQLSSIDQFDVTYYENKVNQKEDELLNQYAVLNSVKHDSQGSTVIKMEDGEYKYKYSDWKSVTRSHLAGNQPATKGYKFPTGGGFYYSNSGGPSTSVSVSFGVGFQNVAFSISFGQRASGVTGVFINAPSKKYYYKLAVKKTYRVRSYIIYRRQTSNSSWYKYSGGSQKELTHQVQWAKKM